MTRRSTIRRPAPSSAKTDGSGTAVTLTLSRSQNDCGLRKLNAIDEVPPAAVTTVVMVV